MVNTAAYRPLRDEEIQTMQEQGCSAEDWSQIQVVNDFQPERVRSSHFAGDVRIGSLAGNIDVGGGVRKPCSIEGAYISGCVIGHGVRIANIGAHVANYDIGSGVVIENVGVMETATGATFGNGVEIEPLNEGGGREMILFNRLDSQFAYLLCVHRYRTKLIEKLQAVAAVEVAKAKSDRGSIGTGARIRNVKQIRDVNIGDYAVIDGAALLENGTVLSSEEAPTTVGTDVQADDFIIAEGTKVTGGAIVSKTFVGQGCQIGKQFSAEGSVFFANCEGFHGEACSIFAGPYTVTHHKSTLLIAGLFSFYNAGSGTNQSNHLYKLGPVHEGKLERGCKTGSFSYMMWPCRVGPFSVVLGKHTRTFDTGDFPFSYLESTPEGRCQMTPGFNYTTVGTVRDGAKWPARDRRKGSVLRDRISFDVFSPLTVGRMMTGNARMKQLQEDTDRAVEIVNINGADVKRVLLRTCQKFYRSAIHMYLLDKVLSRIERAVERGERSLSAAFAPSPDAVFSDAWVDIGGQMMPRKCLDDLCEAIESGAVADLDAINAELDKIHAAYDEDEWAWVRLAYAQVFDADLDGATVDDMKKAADDLLKVRSRFLNLVLNDANKEFDDAVRTGFGQDGTDEEIAVDFTAVRGEFETNKFVKQMKSDLEALTNRVERFKQTVSNF
ncbi:MAG: DUF4954 family protein [Planctomycetes bacterium]|nr:DUF4954 family protein [Planctomycetota bacterium]